MDVSSVINKSDLGSIANTLQSAFAEMFSSTSRLYEFHLGAENTHDTHDDEGDDRARSTSAQLPSLLRFGSSGLLVEGFVSIDSVDGISCREVILLSSSATIELKQLLGQPASLATSLADGSRCYL